MPAGKKLLVRRDANHHFTEVLALQQTDERLRRVLQAVNHLLAVFDFPCLHPAPHLLLELGNPVPVILADNKALHTDAFFEDCRHQQR